MDGWMARWREFTSLWKVFQPYQNDGWVILKGCMQWNPFSDWKDPRLERVSNPWPLDQHRLTHFFFKMKMFSRQIWTLSISQVLYMWGSFQCRYKQYSVLVSFIWRNCLIGLGYETHFLSDFGKLTMRLFIRSDLVSGFMSYQNISQPVQTKDFSALYNIQIRRFKP